MEITLEIGGIVEAVGYIVAEQYGDWVQHLYCSWQIAIIRWPSPLCKNDLRASPGNDVSEGKTKTR